MKSFSKSRFIHSLIPSFEKYGDLVNLLLIVFALAELFLLGLRYSISPLFVTIAILATITLARFFGVLRSNDTGRKHRSTIIHRWTLVSALLLSVTWGASCFFYPTHALSIHIVHTLFLTLIASTFALFFSGLVLFSQFLIVILLLPNTILLYFSPSAGTTDLPIATLVVIAFLLAASYVIGREARVLSNKLANQRKRVITLRNREKRIRMLERIITRKKEKQLHTKNGFPHVDSASELLLQSSNEAVALLTIGGHILRTNTLFKEITGHQKIEIGSTVFSHLFPQKMVDNLDIALQTAVTTGQEISFSITHLGRLHRVLFVPTKDNTNNVLNVTVLFNDVTEYKNQENILSQNTRIWKSVLSLTSQFETDRTWQSCFSSVFPKLCENLEADNIFIARKNGEYIDNTRTSKSTLKRNPYNWIFSIGSWMSTLYGGELIHAINSHLSWIEQNILEREGVKSLVLSPVYRNKDFWGILGIIKTTSKGYFTNQQVNVLKFLSNILALQVSNEKNRSEMQRLTTVVEQSEDCIMITDPNGIVLYTNPASEKITGYLQHELLDKKVQQFHASDNRYKIWEEVDQALKNKERWHGQFINKRKDNTLYEEEMILSPVHDATGELVNLVIIKRNITEAKRLESIAEAANLMDNIGFIFSSLRHELGNPVNSLKVSLSVLESNLDNYDRADIKRFLSRNLADIKRVEYILTSLKNFSVFEKPRVEPVNMVEIIHKFTSLIRPDLQEKDIKLIVNISNKKMIGLIDPRAFQQVMLNLTTNAIDALKNTTNKRITITMYEEENNQINLTIGDNGSGIDEAEQANLFRPFFTTKPKGTGLGLVIVKKMLAKMNCSIDVYSRKSVGTQIFIIIPGQKKTK